MPPVTGFAWYKEDQYDKFIELYEDGANLPKTYASFLKKAEDGMEQLRRGGTTVVKVELDIDEFLAYCCIQTAFVAWANMCRHVMPK